MRLTGVVDSGRLQLLEVLIPVFGIGKGDSFSLEPLMKFVGTTLGNANADVRAAATRVTVLVSQSTITSSIFLKHCSCKKRGEVRPQIELQVKAAKFLPPCWTRQIQTRPKQSWARCSIFILCQPGPFASCHLQMTLETFMSCGKAFLLHRVKYCNFRC